MLITISGLPGAGTSTVARLVAEALGLERIDGGTVFRTMAAERGLDVAAFSRLAESDGAIDFDLDQRLVARARAGDVVLESRLAGWIAVNEGLAWVKVWIEAAAPERARRVAARDGLSHEAAIAANHDRERSEHERYLKYYGIDLDDRTPYDLVFDSTTTAAADIAKSILAAASK